MDECKEKSSIRREIFQKLAGLFLWELPAEIPAAYVEYELLKNGFVAFFKYDGKPQAIRVNFTEEPNAYFVHDKFIYANPVIGGGTLTDGNECVIAYNEPNARWTPRTTYEIIDRYAELGAAVNVSLNVALKNGRLMYFGTADTQQAIQGFNDLMCAVWDGKKAFAINSDTLITDGLKILPAAAHTTDYLRQISECREYIINSCLSSFGVHANTILKRERQLTNEIDLQMERPSFNVYTMLYERKQAAKRLSELFDFPVKVRLNPLLSIVDYIDEDVYNEGVTDESLKETNREIIGGDENVPTESESDEESTENNY